MSRRFPAHLVESVPDPFPPLPPQVLQIGDGEPADGLLHVVPSGRLELGLDAGEPLPHAGLEGVPVDGDAGAVPTGVAAGVKPEKGHQSVHQAPGQPAVLSSDDEDPPQEAVGAGRDAVEIGVCEAGHPVPWRRRVALTTAGASSSGAASHRASRTSAVAGSATYSPGRSPANPSVNAW